MFTLLQPTALTGLLAAFFWGGGDFSGGMAAKNAGGAVRATLRVVLVSHSISFSVLLVTALLRADALPRGLPLLCGVAAGVTGGLSLVCFYIALARGAMGAAAATSGLVAAAIPAAFSIVYNGPPGSLHLVGFFVAGIAIWLVAAVPAGVLEDRTRRFSIQTMLLAVAAGAGFGLYFILLKLSGTAGIAWPLTTARIGSITTCLVLLLLLSRAPHDACNRLPKASIRWSLATALLDTCGNLFFVSATRAGRLDVAAVLASLYPATTILLASVVLKERFSLRQGIGLVVASIAVVMITVL